jgi:hypothetical protein
MVAPEAVSVEAAAAAPVFVGAKGPVTVTTAHSGSFDDDPAQAAQALKASTGSTEPAGSPSGAHPSGVPHAPRATAEGARHESVQRAAHGPNGAGGNGFSRDLDSVPGRLEELVRYHGTDAPTDSGNGHEGALASQRAAPMDDVEGTPAEVVYRPQSREAANPEGVLNGRRS